MTVDTKCSIYPTTWQDDWFKDKEEMSYSIGEKVRKVTGDYQLDGEVRAVFTTIAGKVRVVVEHEPGFLHIYSEANISPKNKTSTKL